MTVIQWGIFFALTIIFWIGLVLIWSKVSLKIGGIPSELSLVLALPAATVSLHIICGCSPISIIVRLFDPNEGLFLLRMMGLLIYLLIWLCWFIPPIFLTVDVIKRWIKSN